MKMKRHPLYLVGLLNPRELSATSTPIISPSQEANDRVIELLSGKEGIISQVVEIYQAKQALQIDVLFSLGHAADACKQPQAVMAFADDQAQNIHYTHSRFKFHVSDRESQLHCQGGEDPCRLLQRVERMTHGLVVWSGCKSRAFWFDQNEAWGIGIDLALVLPVAGYGVLL